MSSQAPENLIRPQGRLCITWLCNINYNLDHALGMEIGVA